MRKLMRIIYMLLVLVISIHSTLEFMYDAIYLPIKLTNAKFEDQ